MKRLMNVLEWINDHTPEIAMAGIYVISMLPLFSQYHGYAHYAGIGGLCGFLAMGISAFANGLKQSTAHLWMFYGVMLLGVVGFFGGFDVKDGVRLTIGQQIFSVYVGAIFGIILFLWCYDLVQSNKKLRKSYQEEKSNYERFKQKEKTGTNTHSLPKEPIIYTNDSTKEKSNLIPMRKGCSNPTCFCTGACQEIIGYIEKDKYDQFINDNLKKP